MVGLLYLFFFLFLLCVLYVPVMVVEELDLMLEIMISSLTEDDVYQFR